MSFDSGSIFFVTYSVDVMMVSQNIGFRLVQCFLQRRNAQIAIVQIVVFSNLFHWLRFDDGILLIVSKLHNGYSKHGNADLELELLKLNASCVECFSLNLRYLGCCCLFVILVELRGALDAVVFFSVRALRSCFEKLMSMRGARGPMRIL